MREMEVSCHSATSRAQGQPVQRGDRVASILVKLRHPPASLVWRGALSGVPWGYRQILNPQQSNPNTLLQIHACPKGMERWDVLFWTWR